MNNDLNPSNDCLRQFDALICQTASEEELATLYAQLQGDPALQQAFLEYCQLHIDLSFELCANQACESFLSCLLWADEPAVSTSQQPNLLAPATRWKAKGQGSTNAAVDWSTLRQKALSWLPLVVVFLIGVLSTLVWVRPSENSQTLSSLPLLQPQRQPDVPLSGESVVAQLVSNTGFVFDISDGKRSIELKSGATLRPEQFLNIPQGVAQLAFSGGADLQLEGPVVLRIDSQGAPELRYGKVFAKAEWGMDAFAIETELGTIWLDNDDVAGIALFGKDLQIHGFNGEVDVTFKDDSFGLRSVTRGNMLSRVLGADRTLQVREKKYTPELFTSRFSIETDTLLVTDAYADMIRQAKPFCYWRFEKVVDGFVPNEMSDKYALRIGGAATIASVSPDNRVIEFGYGPSGGYLIAKEPLTELINSNYTFETWLKPGHSHWGTIAALAQRRTANSPREDHALILELTGASSVRSVKDKPNAFRFLHRATPGDSGGAACYSDEHYRYREWQHVAAVRGDGTLRLFVDGKPVGGRAYRRDLEDELELVIGQLFSFDTIRPLVGQLDEFAIYDRALTPAEVQSHHALLRPAERASGDDAEVENDVN